MSEEALKKEIRQLAKRVAELEADLRAERGEQTPSEIAVRRYGTSMASPGTLHVTLSIDALDLMGRGEAYVDYQLGVAKHHIMTERAHRQKAAS